MDSLGYIAGEFGWAPAVLMDLSWDEIELWLDQAMWTAAHRRGEQVER